MVVEYNRLDKWRHCADVDNEELGSRSHLGICHIIIIIIIAIITLTIITMALFSLCLRSPRHQTDRHTENM